MDQKFAVVTPMKNEAPYILEWVAHYKVLGVDYIVVCTNDCTDTTVPILERLQEHGVVFHHNTIKRGGGIQRSALRQGMRVNKEVANCHWKFFCDVDEFLNIHIGEGTVQEMVLATGEDSDVICIPWRNFTTNGVIDFEDRPVTDQFRMAELGVNPVTGRPSGKYVKSLFTKKRVSRIGVHLPRIKEEERAKAKIMLPGGAPYMINGVKNVVTPIYDVAQVNHYALRSLDAFLVKRVRGRVNHTGQLVGKSYFDRFEVPAERDDSIDRYRERRDIYLKEFHADKILHELHKEGVEWHRRKAASLKMDPDNDAWVSEVMASVNQHQR